MEKTIKEIKECAETLKKSILAAINDFEVANPEIEIRVNVTRDYSSELNKFTHNVDINLSIK